MSETAVRRDGTWTGDERRRNPESSLAQDLVPGSPLDRVSKVTRRLSAAKAALADPGNAPPAGKHPPEATAAAPDEVIETLEDLTSWVVTELECCRALDASSLGEALTDRLLGPVERLGDAVRSTASLARTPHDPRLGRIATVARSRMETVEAVTHDLREALGDRRHQTPPRTVRLDLGQRLKHAAQVAGGPAAGYQVDVPSTPTWITADLHALDKFLLVLLTSSSHHHDLVTGPISATLTVGNTEVYVDVSCSGHRMPLPDLLRVVSRFHDLLADGVADTGIATRDGETTVRSGAVAASTGPDGTTIGFSHALTDDEC